jgi:cytochrome P450
MFRVAVTDTELSGVTIPAAAQVFALIGAANHDPDTFPHPDTADPQRRGAERHLSFGHGIHFCIGAALARLEARVALRLLLQRYRDIDVAGDEQVEHRNPWTMVAVTRLPLQVRAA